MSCKHGGNIWDSAIKAGIEPGDVLDFSASINPYGLPGPAKRALKELVRNPVLSAYPDPDSSELRRALSAIHDIPPECIVPGNGSIELIYALPRAFSPGIALIVDPAFSEYRRSFSLCKVRVRSLALKEKDDFALDVKALKKRLNKIDMVVLANPSNPACSLASKEEIEDLVGACADAGATLVVDEAFIDFSHGASVVTLAPRHKNLVVLRSMTKYFGMAGLRLGYAVAHADSAKRIGEFILPWSINTMAVVCAMEALKDAGYVDKTKRWLKKERVFLDAGLRRLGFKTYPSSANYLMALAPRGIGAKGLRDRLFASGILIRTLEDFKGLGPGHLRVAIRTRKENLRLLSAMEEALRA